MTLPGSDPCPHLPEDWPWISVQVKDSNGNDVAMIEFDRVFEMIGQVWFAPGYHVVGQEPGKDWKLWC